MNAEREISRSQLIKGAMWSLPVIAIAVAAPAAAASTPDVCTPRTVVFDPRDFPAGDYWGINGNAFKVTVIINGNGQGIVTAEAVRDYLNASALNVSHRLFDKTDRSPVGTIKTGTFDGCNPSLIQVDGNNVHWYSHVNGGQGGFQ